MNSIIVENKFHSREINNDWKYFKKTSESRWKFSIFWYSHENKIQESSMFINSIDIWWCWLTINLLLEIRWTKGDEIGCQLDYRKDHSLTVRNFNFKLSLMMF